MQGKIKLKHSETYYLKVLFDQTKIGEIMTSPCISIPVDSAFSKVPELFNQHRIRHLPVVDKSKKLVGLMTQRELYKIHSPRKLMEGGWYYDKDVLDNIVLRNVMNTDLFTLRPEDSIGEALSYMVRTKNGCIPIVDQDKKLVGILTQIDILKVANAIYSE